MGQVFISHVEEDSRDAIQIAKGIEASGYTTWYYERDSLPGISYLLQTKQAIEKSQALILLISTASLVSHQITREVVRAHESGKAFIPVLVDVSHAEFQSLQPEWVEAIGAAASVSLPEEGVERLVPRLVKGLESLGIFAKGGEPEGAPSLQETKSDHPDVSGMRERDGRVLPSERQERERVQEEYNRLRRIVAAAIPIVFVLAVIAAWGLLRIFSGGERNSTAEKQSPEIIEGASLLENSSQVSIEGDGFLKDSPESALTEESSPQTEPLDEAENDLPGETWIETPAVSGGYLLPLADLYDLVYNGKLCGLFDGQLVALELVEVENRFRAAERESGFNANSLAWDAERRQFWAVRGSPHIVYRDVDVLDPTGAPVHTYRVADTVNYLRHAAWDGTYLWTTTTDETLYQWLPSTTSNELRLIDSYAPKIGSFTGREAGGLTWDGANLWILTDDVLARLGAGGRVECKVKLSPVGGGPSWYGYRGLAWDGQALWVGHSEENMLFRVDPDVCP
jgi:hypothetical protein